MDIMSRVWTIMTNIWHVLMAILLTYKCQSITQLVELCWGKCGHYRKQELPLQQLKRLETNTCSKIKEELWKLQGQNEIPERWSFFPAGICRSWSRVKPAKLSAVAQDWHYELETKEVLTTQLCLLEFEGRRWEIGSQAKKIKSLWSCGSSRGKKNEPCIQHKTGFLHKTFARF